MRLSFQASPWSWGSRRGCVCVIVCMRVGLGSRCTGKDDLAAGRGRGVSEEGGTRRCGVGGGVGFTLVLV